jgi:hypothetical protein
LKVFAGVPVNAADPAVPEGVRPVAPRAALRPAKHRISRRPAGADASASFSPAWGCASASAVKLIRDHDESAPQHSEGSFDAIRSASASSFSAVHNRACQIAGLSVRSANSRYHAANFRNSSELGIPRPSAGHYRYLFSEWRRPGESLVGRLVPDRELERAAAPAGRDPSSLRVLFSAPLPTSSDSGSARLAVWRKV